MSNTDIRVVVGPANYFSHSGPTDSDMNPANSEREREQVKQIALGYYGTPEDIAAATFLAGSSRERVWTSMEGRWRG